MLGEDEKGADEACHFNLRKEVEATVTPPGSGGRIQNTMCSISVVMCTYNGARYLEAQLLSLRAQAGVEEILAVDDASTDDTVAILHQHSLVDPRVRIVCNRTRLGVTRNFDKAVRLAKGRWIALADQDDVWMPHKIARMRKAWDGRSVVMHHASLKFRGTVPRSVPARAGLSRKFAGHDVRRLCYRNSVVGHTTLLRADVARALTPFPVDVPYDWWIGAGGALQGGVQYLDEYLVHYRIHETNAYHPAGSRLKRLREEYELRLRLLEALLRARSLGRPQRRFVEGYRDLLVQAGTTGGFPWRLAGFYLRHANVLFGETGREIDVFTAWRKSAAAAMAAWWSAGVGAAVRTKTREFTAVERPVEVA